MAEGIRARLSPAEGRRFAFTVGAAFLVLAAVSGWRGHPVLAYAFSGVGSVLLLAGLVVPGRLSGVYRAWMGMALAISKVTTPVFMTLVYVLALLPTGLLMRMAGRNPLRHAPGEAGFWIERPGSRDRRAMERQF